MATLACDAADMIKATVADALTDLIRRLRQKGERIAKERAQQLRPRDGGRSHKWRDAENLWPDIFEDH